MGKGDLGLTDLFGGKRVSKTDRRVKLNALIDELSALLGLLKSGLKAKRTKNDISAAQTGLARAAGAVAGTKISLDREILQLGTLITEYASEIKPPKKFTLPGANKAEALAHLALARARVCEILSWEIKAKAPAVYLNRLSDYLFLVALKSVRGTRQAP